MRQNAIAQAIQTLQAVQSLVGTAKTKRRKFGSIRKVGAGKYRVRITAMSVKIDNRYEQLRVSKTIHGYSAAVAWLREQESNMQTIQPGLP